MRRLLFLCAVMTCLMNSTAFSSEEYLMGASTSITPFTIGTDPGVKSFFLPDFNLIKQAYIDGASTGEPFLIDLFSITDVKNGEIQYKAKFPCSVIVFSGEGLKRAFEQKGLPEQLMKNITQLGNHKDLGYKPIVAGMWLTSLDGIDSLWEKYFFNDDERAEYYTSLIPSNNPTQNSSSVLFVRSKRMAFIFYHSI